MKAWTRHAFLVLAAILAPLPAGAQDFPSRPITLVVPYLPGSFPDMVARTFGEKVQAGTGTNVIVENKPGGAGIVAAERVLQSPHDGYTLLIGDQQQWGIARHVVANLSFDPLKDLAPVSILAISPMFVVVGEKVGVKTMPELVAKAKAAPEKLSFGSPGIASIHHLAWETILAQTGTKITHVPYKGSAQVVPAVISGEIDMALQTMPNVAPHAQAGKLRVLGVATAERSPQAPEIPTLIEQGVPDIDFPATLVLIAPRGTPEVVRQKLSAEFGKAARQPELVEHFRKMSIITVGSTPREAIDFVARDAARIDKAAKTAGLKPQ